MNQSNAEDPSTMAAPARRHGCLTTYLIFVIIVNSCVALVYLFGTEWLHRNGQNAPQWALLLLAAFGIVNVISAVALLRWKRWGFWLFVISAIGALGINFLIGLGPQGIFGAVLGIAVLYAVLHIGGERKAWPRLQ